MSTTSKLLTLMTAVLLALSGAAACSSSDSSAPANDLQAESAPTTQGGPKPITIVVTNDDGIGAPGIDELATELSKLPEVTVKVVAPAENQSGKGDKTTEGTVKHHPGKTASGIEGVAVEGTPADSVNVALDELGLKPDLVASGINKGQNVGPLVDISGTVGAALTAVRQDIPAVAGSAGLKDPDYEGAAAYVVDWVTKNRNRIARDRMASGRVVNFNVPGCSAGSAHGLVQVSTADELPTDGNVFSTDCSADKSDERPTTDVEALMDGYAAQSYVPAS